MFSKWSLFFLLVMVFLGSGFTLPKMTVQSQSAHLFYLGRSKDANQIFYDLNWTSEGKLFSEEPIKAYWIKFAENGRIESLTAIQRKLAYGLEFEMLSTDVYVFNFVSYPDRKLLLKKDQLGIFHVYLDPASALVVLDAIYVKIEGGTFWVPNVTQVSVYGNKSSNALAYEEHIIP